MIPPLEFTATEVLGVVFLACFVSIGAYFSGFYERSIWVVGLIAVEAFIWVLVFSHALTNYPPERVGSIISHSILFALYMFVGIIIAELLKRKFGDR